MLEEDLIRLPVDTWDAMVSAAVELDLIHGGYFRARTGSILFYASPENAPRGWEGGFSEGSPDLLRALAGEAEVAGVSEAKIVTVRLKVSNWGAMRSLKHAFDQGAYRGRFEQYVHDQEAALRGRQAERDWLRAQFERLRRHATGVLLEG